MQQQQQQRGYPQGVVSKEITTLVNLFKEHGETSLQYKKALEQLPAQDIPCLKAALYPVIQGQQQQQLQLQM